MTQPKIIKDNIVPHIKKYDRSQTFRIKNIIFWIQTTQVNILLDDQLFMNIDLYHNRQFKNEMVADQYLLLYKKHRT